MNHLPLPRDPNIGSFDIPFLCTESYDNGDFLTYPERRGWTVKLYEVECVFEADGEVVVAELPLCAFLQTWLYFGLLFQVTGHEVDRDLFKALSEHGVPIINTAPLEDIVVSWSSRKLESCYHMSDEDIYNWRDQLSTCFRRTRDTVRGVLASEPIQSTGSLAQVCMSVTLLGEYLLSSLRHIFEDQDLDPPTLLAWRTPGIDPARPLIDQMKGMGWCPRMLSHIERCTRSVSTLWFYANIVPPFASDDHKRCFSHLCQSLQVDKGTYETAHCTIGCTCRSYGPCPVALAQIVTTGETPLVSISSGSTGEIVVNLHTYREDTDFVAISHVWADGNGNLFKNELPGCVLTQIQRCVNHVSQLSAGRTPDKSLNVPFWMDTLCLPRHPLQLRRKAVLTLDKPFRNATNVLVLDSYLRRHDPDRATRTEAIAKISLSPWTHRLWTLCEGRLAKSVWIQLKGTAINLNEDMKSWIEEQERFPTLASSMVHDTVVATFSATDVFELPDEQHVLALRQALKNRSTSWSFDEPICLAILLGIDMSAVARSSDADKMKSLWQQFEKIPGSVVFSSASQKLSHEGFRWAPASLMGDHDWHRDSVFVPVSDATCCPEGLLVNLHALSFPAGSASQFSEDMKNAFIEACVPEEEHGLLALIVCGVEDDKGHWYECTFEKRWHQERPSLIPRGQQPVILLSAATGSYQNSRKDVLHGVLAAYDEFLEVNDFKKVKVYSHVVLELSSDPKETEYRQALKDCAAEVEQELGENLEAMRTQPRELKTFVTLYIDGCPSKQRLLDLGSEVPSNWLGYEFEAEEYVLLMCANLVFYFLMVGPWYMVRETSEAIGWCID